MFIDLSPLKKYPAFRNLFLGQLVSTLGSNISNVAAPYFIYNLTHSTAKVGLLGVTTLIPLVLFGFWGGAIADSSNRKRIIITCEVLLAFLCCLFAYLVQVEALQEWMVYALNAIMAALSGFHRPALESLTPRLIERADMAKVSALQGFRGTFAHIIGPAIGGLLIAKGGVAFSFWIDAATFVFSIFCLIQLTNPPRESKKKQRPDLAAILEGFRYALQRPLLMGTYLVDIVAMSFCNPVALFPAIAEISGGASRLGPLYSAISIGALLASLLSRWTLGARKHGALVSFGAAIWCVSILLFAVCFQFSYWLGFALLALAGYGDMISAMFRQTIWNENIPDSHRGRLAGIEMISYMAGPMIGNTLMGYLAAVSNVEKALSTGAVVALIGVGLLTYFLSTFRNYTSETASQA
jgi:MFS family permease